MVLNVCGIYFYIALLPHKILILSCYDWVSIDKTSIDLLEAVLKKIIRLVNDPIISTPDTTPNCSRSPTLSKIFSWILVCLLSNTLTC